MTALEQALNVGYRAIDTAQMYEMNGRLGKFCVIIRRSQRTLYYHQSAASELPRRPVYGFGGVKPAALNVEQVDVLLLHSPPKQDFSATLRLLEQA